jgi:hypothetical protein
MILSAQSIRRRCVEHDPPLVTPFVERDVSPGGKSFGLGPASYDVRLDQRLRLPPHGFALASTLERFCMPVDVAGTVRDKSSWARVPPHSVTSQVRTTDVKDWATSGASAFRCTQGHLEAVISELDAIIGPPDSVTSDVTKQST